MRLISKLTMAVAAIFFALSVSAQEAQVLYPQHVTQDASGYLMLNYAALNSI